MKISISFHNRFWSFNLAREMFRHGVLSQFITSYPKFAVARYGIPRNITVSLPSNEVLRRAWQYLPVSLKPGWNLQFFLNERFDRLAAARLRPGADIFDGLSSCSLQTLRRAKTFGMIGIIERGSSHILHQQQIINEEDEKLGMKTNQTHPMIIEKELNEYSEADYIYVPSNFVKKTFLAQGVPEDKLIHVPFGVDLEEFYPVQRKNNTFRVIHCGALSLRKGVHYLLQAFAELRLPNSELWLVGGVKDEIVPFLKRYKADNVIVHGSKPQAELRKYYSQADVFCLASLEEGLAMVQAQAMACGLPVICTENTGGSDIITDGREGFIVPIRDLKALQEKIVWAYENREECKSMGKAARLKVSR
ncbi:MAG TPA: glycosyltransferase family 1 protein, partial [Nitrospirae bacterium]|nr:glycosyltransferase family 1 protein [Nitrospirota bacterium]